MLHQARLEESLNLVLYDTALRLRPLPSAARLPVRVVAIEEVDLRRFGAPVDDGHLVAAIRRLEAAGARAIGLDLYRDLGVGPQQGELRRLATQPGPLITVFSLIDAVGPVPGSPPQRRGYNDLLLDRDGVVRRDLVHVRGQEPALVALPLRLLEHSRGPGPGPLLRLLEREPARLAPLGPHSGGYSDLDAAGLQRLLPFHDPATIPSWSLRALLSGQVPASALRDTIVLIGSRAPSQRDRFAVPIDRDGAGNPGQMAGVDLHAQRLVALLAWEQGLRPGLTAAPGWLNGLLVVAGLAAGVVLGEGVGSLRRSVRRVALLAGLALAIGLAALLLGGLWCNLSLPLASLVAVAAAAWSARGAEQQGQRRQLQRLLGQAVSPAVAQELWQERTSLLAGDRFRGRRLFATVLVADIAGFTALAERTDPETLLAWLNRCLEQVVGPIERGGGLVNKFTGDGLLAVFGAPLSQGRTADATAAVAAARAIRTGIETLNTELAGEGQPPVRLRLGVHSGWVVAGSVGGRDRWEYGVIGDAVNCASRIEGLPGSSRPPGCRILVSAATLALAGDTGRPWGPQRLSGRQREEEIWEL